MEFIGEPVRKHFKGFGWFSGIVTDVVDVNGETLGFIEYEDGDTEALPREKLRELVRAARESSPEDSGRKKRKHRKRQKREKSAKVDHKNVNSGKDACEATGLSGKEPVPSVTFAREPTGNMGFLPMNRAHSFRVEGKRRGKSGQAPLRSLPPPPISRPNEDPTTLTTPTNAGEIVTDHREEDDSSDTHPPTPESNHADDGRVGPFLITRPASANACADIDAAAGTRSEPPDVALQMPKDFSIRDLPLMYRRWKAVNRAKARRIQVDGTAVDCLGNTIRKRNEEATTTNDVVPQPPPERPRQSGGSPQDAPGNGHATDALAIASTSANPTPKPPPGHVSADGTKRNRRKGLKVTLGPLTFRNGPLLVSNRQSRRRVRNGRKERNPPPDKPTEGKVDEPTTCPVDQGAETSNPEKSQHCGDDKNTSGVAGVELGEDLVGGCPLGDRIGAYRVGHRAPVEPNWGFTPGVCRPSLYRSNRDPCVKLTQLCKAKKIRVGERLSFVGRKREVLAVGWASRGGVLCGRCGWVVDLEGFAVCAGVGFQDIDWHVENSDGKNVAELMKGLPPPAG